MTATTAAALLIIVVLLSPQQHSHVGVVSAADPTTIAAVAEIIAAELIQSPGAMYNCVANAFWATTAKCDQLFAQFNAQTNDDRVTHGAIWVRSCFSVC